MDSHACKPDYASVYTSLHEEVVLGCSKHIQMAQNVFPRPNWALKWAVIIRSAIRFDDFFGYSRSSNSTIPRAKSVCRVFICCTRTYFWNAPHLACSLSLDLLLFGISECDFRDRDIVDSYIEDEQDFEGSYVASKTGLRPGTIMTLYVDVKSIGILTGGELV